MKNSVFKIIIKNTFTLFNIVNIILAAMVWLVDSSKNMLFLVIAAANTLISIVNELRAKRIVDKLKLLSEKKPTIMKNGKPTAVAANKVSRNDLLVLTLGDQIAFDSQLEEGILEVNESFVTGEQDNIEKRPGDELISGSFVVSGSGRARVKNVGADNFVNKLQAEASYIKTADSKLFRLMNNIVKYISWTLIPIGALLLWSRLRNEADTATAVTSTVAALISMIPEGLILLTSSVLALATVRLGKRKVLVQDLYAVETLARVDTICLDKTGTLTSGNMTVKDYTAHEKSFESVLKSILSHQASENATITALKKKFAKGTKFGEIEGITDVIPFSSDRKYSGIKVGSTEYLLGAAEFITDNKKILKAAASSDRTLVVVKRTASKTKLLGVIHLEDEIRSTAPQIIKYFVENKIAVKIISGDDLEAVLKIAKSVGLEDLKGINLATTKKPNYQKLVEEFSVFARVKPSEKKRLIQAFKKQGHTVAMTGDGVNDILAMKEADCSIAIGEGSDAARRAAKFVLLDSGFEGIPKIVDEGRQSINNLERSTALFLAKTVYASLLAIIFVFLPFSYPFSPIEMSLLSFACIGLPGLILALEKNTEPLGNRFIRNIVHYSVPIGLTVCVSMLALSTIARFGHFTRAELNTDSLFITFAIDFTLIYWLSKPLNKLRIGLLLSIIAIVLTAFFVPFSRNFFEFTLLNPKGLLIVAGLTTAAIVFFFLVRLIAKKLFPNKDRF